MEILDASNQLSPWSAPRDPDLIFPMRSYEKLLLDLGWEDPLAWLQHWIERGAVNLAYSAWPPNIRTDWLWGLGLPFLSDLEQYIATQEHQIILGISGLPGCGKTSFGKWIEAAAVELDWSVSVMSMDDFYLPGTQLDQAMAGNPWNVPRGLPGSHSIDLFEQTIDTWMKKGDLCAPQFDKALRNGRGDRSGWRLTSPKILVIEGWFLGCATTHLDSYNVSIVNESTPPLLISEYEYRSVVQASLERYQFLWKKFGRIWHLKASEFNATSLWKSQQEMNMQEERGASLKGKSLDSFIRMIQTSIPKRCLQSIDCSVVAQLSRSREITWVGTKATETLMEEKTTS